MCSSTHEAYFLKHIFQFFLSTCTSIIANLVHILAAQLCTFYTGSSFLIIGLTRTDQSRNGSVIYSFVTTMLSAAVNRGLPCKKNQLCVIEIFNIHAMTGLGLKLDILYLLQAGPISDS